jgi:hypothetical protein
MRTLRWLWPVPAIALAVLVPWACYAVRAPRPLDLVVLDKTVPFRTWIEHRSLFWLLDHTGVVTAKGAPYDETSDYLGAYPPQRAGDPPASTRDLSAADVAAARLIYLADTYGVHALDLVSGEAQKAALERSETIYGGLTPAEARAAAFAPSAGKTLIAEFNTLGSPTGAEARATLEDALGVRWTRWIGRYFMRLEDRSEVPEWMRRDYEREWKRPWEFRGPGYVLMQDDTHCEVLRVGFEADAIGLTIERERPIDPALSLSADGVPYPYWFDVVEAGPDARHLASFQWHLTPAGLDRLRARGLPERFPAVTRKAAGGRAPAWYFAGDFADNPMDARPVPFAGFLTLRRTVERMKLAPSETAFYWTFYAPMMERIVGALAEERTP